MKDWFKESKLIDKIEMRLCHDYSHIKLFKVVGGWLWDIRRK